MLVTSHLDHGSCCTCAELEGQTNHLRARASKASSNVGALAEVQAALAVREQQLQEASKEMERLREMAQVGTEVVACCGLRGMQWMWL